MIIRITGGIYLILVALQGFGLAAIPSTIVAVMAGIAGVALLAGV